MTARRPIRRALVSVYDKTGLPELAAALHAAGTEIVSTGSTAAVIREQGIPVLDAAEVTGFPEMLDGRVKTLHPAIHGGLLADVRHASHREQIEAHGIAPIDLLVVNLYPFEDTVGAGGTFEEIIEKIDIGGPAMVRSAAKNFENVAVVVSSADYALAGRAAAEGGFTRSQRQALSAIAFAHITAYDEAIGEWTREQLAALEDLAGDELDPAAWSQRYLAGAEAADAAQNAEHAQSHAVPTGDDDTEDAQEALLTAADAEDSVALRYGENPHQRARLLIDPDAAGALATAELLGGKPMSYNNYVDADAALRAAFDHEEACVAVVKHNNPCGIATSAEDDIAAAHAKAHATDPVSAYGGVIAANRPVSLAMAQQVAPVFTEVITAPGYEPEALDVLRGKKNLRILEVAERPEGGLESREIWGGTLVQDADAIDADGDDPATWRLAAGPAADAATLADLAFAWRAVRAAKSNAILLAHDRAAVGIGMGQVNRLDSCRLAVARANTLGVAPEGEEGAMTAPMERARGAVAASDAFFPFADGVEILLEAGVRAIVQPGGSIRDEEVIAACQEAGVTLYLTGTRHFAH